MATEIIEEAVRLAHDGWAVFPLHETQADGTCSCGKDCGKNRGKHPRIKAWQENATRDIHQVEKWWKRWPTANIGLHCGKSGVIVVDLDVKNGTPGPENWRALCERLRLNGGAVDTYHVDTPTGGQHLYFDAPENVDLSNTAGSLGAGIDTRAGNGYVLAPPSQIGGAPYVGGPEPTILPLPAAILDLLLPKTPTRPTPTPTPTRPTGRNLSPYVQAALDAEYRTVRDARPGTRDDTLFQAAENLGDLVGADWAELDRQVVIDTLMGAFRQSSLSDELSEEAALDKINRGIDRAMLTPRPEPMDKRAALIAPPVATVATEIEALNHTKANTTEPELEADQEPKRGFFRCTDMGNGQRLAAWYGQEIRYCEPWKNWLLWDGTRWAIDETCAIEWTAKQAVRGIYGEAARCEDDDTRKAIGSWARASESGSRRREMIAAARSEPGIAITPLALDADPWVLNVNNGLLNLRTGKLEPHDRGQLVTKLAPVTYDARAACPLWLEFLARIMAGDQVMIDFLQRAIGYTLTGDVSERALFILHGTGDNGKSTMLETVRAMLGDYAMSAEAKTLMRHDRGAATSDIARLKGARLVTASESERGDKLAEALVKQLTGGDRRTARFLHQNEIEYTPTDKLWLGTNHRPEITGTDRAIWTRIKLIPFAVTIPKSEQDTQLKAKLEAELPGILAWAVRGCLDWQKSGLAIPEKVTAATGAYRQESDELGRFIADACIVHENAKITLKALYDTYLAWCIDTGEANVTKRDLSIAMVERGFTKYIGAGNRTFLGGIGQKGQESEPQEPEPLNF